MKEYAPRTSELTVRRVSSTLDVRSTMPEPPKEPMRPVRKVESPTRRDTSVPPRTTPEGWERNAAENVRSISEMLRSDPDFMADPEAFLRKAASRAEELVRQQSGARSDREQREQIIKSRYAERLSPDLENVAQLQPPTPPPPDENYTEDDIEAFLKPESRRESIVHPIGSGGVSDPEFKNILLTFNRDAESERMQSDEYALQNVSATIKNLTDRMNNAAFPIGEREAAFQALDAIKNTELRLITSPQRERSAEEQEQVRVYKMTQEFEKEFAVEVDLERRGQEQAIDPDRRKLYRGARQFLVRKIEEQMEQAPSVEASRFPPLIMEMASKFTETREMLINEILFKPYSDKTQQGHFEINLYASGHVDELLATLARRAKNPAYKKDVIAYERYQALKTTSRNFWEMNRGLWTGNLDVFSRIAEEMNYDQFETMQRIAGVGETMRLYDEKFMQILARDHRITSKNLEEIKDLVRGEMTRMNDLGLMQSDYFNEREGSTLEKRKLEKWELDRAINVGFVFFNITFRGPELASLSQLETGDRQFASFPYENAARMLNIILTADRFEIAAERGGMDFMNRARANNVRLMEEDGRHQNINRFKEINGVSVSDVEWMAAMGISGIFSGWRMSTMAYEGVEVRLGRGAHQEVTNLWKYMKERKMHYHGDEVNGVQGLIHAIKGDGSLSMEQKQDAIVRALDPLIGREGNLDVGLGMLLRLGQGNQGKGGFLAGKEGYKARKAIWERVAERNPLIAANMLTNLIQNNGDEYAGSLKNILGRNGWITTDQAGITDVNNPNYFLNSPRWQQFRTKLQYQHEIMVKQQSSDPEDRRYAQEMRNSDAVRLTSAEQALLHDIQTAGKGIAGDMADIVFPYMIFMNDMPFEKFTWTGPGAQFFKRRIGDIGSYNKAIGAATGMMDNLGGMKVEDVVKGLKDIQRGIESPNGPGSGWTAVLPFVLAYLEMAQTYEGWESQGLIKGARLRLNKPTSILQKYVGVHAPSMDESAAYDFLHTLFNQGVIDHHSEEIIRKWRRLTLWDILFSYFRDLTPVFVTSMLIDTPKQSVNLK